uniref:BPTI/Kunitz inhibitor domain-containing protein n=1 Tax=Steinernema glaseri TaxID=37863 RepID=A0A1I8AST8_9BILA
MLLCAKILSHRRTKADHMFRHALSRRTDSYACDRRQSRLVPWRPFIFAGSDASFEQFNDDSCAKYCAEGPGELPTCSIDSGHQDVAIGRRRPVQWASVAFDVVGGGPQFAKKTRGRAKRASVCSLAAIDRSPPLVRSLRATPSVSAAKRLRYRGVSLAAAVVVTSPPAAQMIFFFFARHRRPIFGLSAIELLISCRRRDCLLLRKRQR